MSQMNIKNKIKSFPASPGVYQFIDNSGGVLYIGKAKNLKNRIKSYFLKNIGRGPGIDNMVSLAKNIKYIETESEIEAIILEAEMVNKILPKYNIRLRDDKSFLVIKIEKPVQKSILLRQGSAGQEVKSQKSNLEYNNSESLYPKVELVRFKNIDTKDKSAEYFGPYPSGELLKRSINYLRKVFPFRDCSKTKFNTYQKKGRPCIYGDIRVCTAPCAEWTDQRGYNRNIVFLKHILRGKKREIVDKLTKEMKSLSRAKNFENAALLRDQLNALNHLKNVAVGIRDDIFNPSKILFKRIECYDISNIGGEYGVGSMVVFRDFKSDKDEYRKFKIKFADGANDLLMMREMLTRRFKNDWTLPDLIVIDGGETHLRIAFNILKKIKQDIPIVSIAKGPGRKKNEFHFSGASIAKYVKENKDLENVLISARDEAHRFAISYYRKLHKKDMFE